MPHWADNFKLRWKDHTLLGCGTAIGWRRGCHCESCREWHRKSVADWRAGKRSIRTNARLARIRALAKGEKMTPECGTWTAWVKTGCLCEFCKEWKRKVIADSRKRTKARDAANKMARQRAVAAQVRSAMVSGGGSTSEATAARPAGFKISPTTQETVWRKRR